MSVLKISAAALALSLGLEGTASAQWGPGWGHGHGWDRGHHYGWRHHGPRCWTERIVHRTPWGPRVDYRRVCR
jgi:hypothetical protein